MPFTKSIQVILALPCLALPYLTLSCLTLRYPTLPYLTLPLDSGVSNSDDTYETDVKVDPSRVQEIAQWGDDNGVSKRAAITLNNREYRWPNKILKYKIERSRAGKLLAIVIFLVYLQRGQGNHSWIFRHMNTLAKLINHHAYCSIEVKKTKHHGAADGGQPVVIRVKKLMQRACIWCQNKRNRCNLIKERDIIKFACSYK
jgi:hypothetical protein